MHKFLARFLFPPEPWDPWVDVPEWFQHPDGGYVVRDVVRGTLYRSHNGWAWRSYYTGRRCSLHGAERSLINYYRSRPWTWRVTLPLWEGP